MGKVEEGGELCHNVTRQALSIRRCGLARCSAGKLCHFRALVIRSSALEHLPIDVCVAMSCASRILRPTVRARRTCDVRQTWRRCLNVPAAELRFGQPLHETHPHLLKAGEGATTHCIARCVLTNSYSHPWHHSPRVLPTEIQSCQRATAQFHSHPRCFGPQICLGCRLLQVSPRSRLSLPHWLPRARCTGHHREVGRTRTHIPSICAAKGSKSRSLGRA